MADSDVPVGRPTRTRRLAGGARSAGEHGDLAETDNHGVASVFEKAAAEWGAQQLRGALRTLSR
ncbi:MAG TPA: hypothetical protein VES60_05240 [Nakamurella sp.]|nr:hypothetical protein [Nakamurella sp.]